MQKIKFQTSYDDKPRYALTVTKTPPPPKKPLSAVRYGGRINSSTYDAARAAEFDEDAILSVQIYYGDEDAMHDIKNLEFIDELIVVAA